MASAREIRPEDVVAWGLEGIVEGLRTAGLIDAATDDKALATDVAQVFQQEKN